MNQRKAKLFRKLFKERKQYRAFKETYIRSPLEKRLEASEKARQIVASGKEIKTAKVKA